MNLQLGVTTFNTESDRVLCILQHWANQAHKYSRQRHHVGWTPDESSVPPMEVLAAQSDIQKPAVKPQADRELDIEDGIEPEPETEDGSDDGGDSSRSFVASACSMCVCVTATCRSTMVVLTGARVARHWRGTQM